MKYKGTYYKILENTNPDFKGHIVCIHGIGACTSRYDSIAPLLAANGYTLIMYDLIGRGLSDYPDNGVFDSTSHVEQLYTLLTHLGITQYHLMGHSMGGALATLYYNKYAATHTIESVILLAPAGLVNSWALKAVRACPTWIQTVLSWFTYRAQNYTYRRGFVDTNSEAAKELMEEMHIISIVNPRAFDAKWESLMHFPLYGLENDIVNMANTCPKILLLWGQKDAVIDCNSGFAAWKILLGLKGYTHLYENLGHDFFVESPKEVAEHILAFL